MVNFQLLIYESDRSIPGNLASRPWGTCGWYLNVSYNCFDTAPGSPFMTMVPTALQHWAEFYFVPQSLACFAVGDLNNDGCVDRADLTRLTTAVRTRSTDFSYDLNGDGKVDIADARFLALHFTNPDGTACSP